MTDNERDAELGRTLREYKEHREQIGGTSLVRYRRLRNTITTWGGQTRPMWVAMSLLGEPSVETLVEFGPVIRPPDVIEI